MKQHIGIAISGGVDSTATALLLKKNHRITGFFMNLGQPNFLQQKQRVEELADRIGFKIHILDLKDRFSDLVLDYFTNCYFSGETPNPCMTCNREIKFGLFLDAILQTGVDKVATGHYARVEHTPIETVLLTGTDPRKDQSYFLARVDADRLSHVIFPLGNMYKNEIYSYVESEGFTCFRGKESQDICFLENTNVVSFLESQPDANTQQGPIITTEGKQIGSHKGLFRYTIGQRRGLGLPDVSPWYVTGIKTKENTLIIGKNEALLSREVSAVSSYWLTKKSPKNGEKYNVRIRYSHPGANATIYDIEKNSFQLLFDEPQRAIAPGQFAVLYAGDRVIGSGVICQKS